LGVVLNRLDLRGVDDIASRLPRLEGAGSEPVDAVRAILADVRDRGDAAVRELTRRFDGVALETSRVAPDEVRAALDAAPPPLVDALVAARDAIRDFHVAQLREAEHYERDGVVIEARAVPVGRAGLYVPGGRAAYPSTVLMTAVPARVAGVDQVVLCVPPDRTTGTVAPSTLAAAALAEVDEVHAVGGAQAIGAMAYGTETIARVDVVAGPGNVYVAVAQREVAGEVGVPRAFAGPSEIVVVADDTTPPDYAAVDLIVQAEHGPGGLAWLVTWSPDAADRIEAAVERLVASAPRKADIESTLRNGGWTALVDGPEQAIEVADQIAPEHLQLMSADPHELATRVRNAGAVFCGPLTPASIGDYIAGPSHVLPTHGTARFASALTVDDFMKIVHTISVDQAAFDKVAPFVETLAQTEGLDAHATSIRLRRDLT
jgi:histidinol dehydrogenase